jgi:hypothetical protein
MGKMVDVTNHQAGRDDVNRAIWVEGVLDPHVEQHVVAVSPHGCMQASQLIFRQRSREIFEDEYFLTVPQVFQQFATQEALAAADLPLGVRQRNTAGWDVEALRHPVSSVPTPIVARTVFRHKDDRVFRLTNAGEVQLKRRGKQIKAEVGPSQQTERFRTEMTLQQTKFATMTGASQALERH